MLVVGADATPGGWACSALRDGVLEVTVVATAAEIAARWRDAEVIGIDIPIGLPAAGQRRADLAARRFLGLRRSTVWLTPTRAVLEGPWGPGLHVTRQAHGMGARIFDVERVRDARFHEVHPEVTFAFLNGGAPLAPKRTWEGLAQRLRLLDQLGLAPPPLAAPADDVLDSAAVAFSARRIARGEARMLPPAPEPGEPVIWY